jgi:protein ImuA
MSSVPQSDCTPRDSRGRLMQQLRGQLSCWEATALAEDTGVFSSGAAAIDRLLPDGGLRHGMLVEWLGGDSVREVISKPSPLGRGQGEGRAPNSKTPSPQPSPGGRGSAVTLSLLAAREACREGGTLVVIDGQQTFYPPAAAAWGIDMDRLIVVRSQSARDELWAAVQSLRSPAVAAVWGMIDRLDSRAFRRLQLAAQAGRTLGLLLRPPSARGQPSWADVRLGVSTEQGAGSGEHEELGIRDERWRQTKILHPSSFIFHPSFSRRIQIHVLRTRGGRTGGWATLEVDDAAYTVREASSNHDTHPLPVARELADPADRSFPARA